MVKRSEALRSLSPEHHQALTITKELRRTDDPERASARFREFWKQEGALHFPNRGRGAAADVGAPRDR
jgi:hypothetical protein